MSEFKKSKEPPIVGEGSFASDLMKATLDNRDKGGTAVDMLHAMAVFMGCLLGKMEPKELRQAAALKLSGLIISHMQQTEAEDKAKARAS